MENNYIYRFFSPDFIPKKLKTLKDEILIIYFPTADGQFFIDNHTDDIKSNYLFYLPPETSYKIECNSNFPLDCFFLSIKNITNIKNTDIPELPFLIKVPFYARKALLNILESITVKFINSQIIDTDSLSELIMEIKQIIDENRILFGIRNYDDIPPRDTLHHSHVNEYQIDYFQTGNGKFWINDSWKKYESGDFFFIPPNTFHEIIYNPKAKNDNYCFKFVINSKNLPFDLSEAYKLKIPVNYQNKMNDILKNMLGQFILEKELFPNQIIDFLSFVYNIKNQYGAASADNNNKINDIKEIIELNYSQKLTLEWLSGQVGISPEYLSRLFKKETGLTLSSFISNTRLEKSRSMLTETDKSVKEIASECGFLNSQYFNRAFKKQFNEPPLRMKKSFITNS